MNERLGCCAYGVLAGSFARMSPSPRSTSRRWDSSCANASQRRPLRVDPDGISRLLRCGQSGSCRECGNSIEWYVRDHERQVRLHPQELPADQVPEDCRWHVSSGVAYPAGDGSRWCRVPHAVLCPARPVPPSAPQLSGLRRSLALRTRWLLDAGAFVPSAVPSDGPLTGSVACRPARPIVQLLYVRYLAACPVDEIQCVAQTRHRHRCIATVLSPDATGGVWTLVPVSGAPGQLALPSDVMAVYSLSALSYQEQLRWRAQRCVQHDASRTAADLEVADWEPFDALRHHEFIRTRLPLHGRPSGPGCHARRWARS
ncbi:DUF6083 domain-containing protein [Streptomyces sp. NPDC006251]|uniref:DUF6083 domain-containing protein n=1 Tax=Streptomyces sp. NPDC006251 TaxID=3155718 RepID=UPI0033AAC6A1